MRSGNQKPDFYPWKQGLLTLLFFTGFKTCLVMQVWWPVIYGLGGAAAWFGVLTAIKLVGVYRYWRLIAGASKPSGLYGSAYKPGAKDAKRFGLTYDNPKGDGMLIAAKDGKLLFYQGNSMVTCVAANGGGKSASSAIPIGLSLGKHRNLVFTGKGLEVADAITSYRRDVLGQRVYINDPWQMGGVDNPGYNINPMGDLHGFVAKEHPEALDIPESKALLLIPEGKGDAKFFSDFARATLSKCMVFMVWQELETGWLCGNLPSLYECLNGSDRDVRNFLADMRGCEIYGGSVKKAAERLLAMLDQSPKTGMSVLAEMANALTLFDPASKLGQNIQCSDFDLEDIKKMPMSIGICIPPDKVATHGVYMGLVIDMLIGICLRARCFEPRVTFCLDEFANLARGEIPSITPALYLGRSLGCQLVTYVQDTSTFERYQDKSAFVTQAEVYMAWSIRSTKDAEDLSKRSGNYTAITENTNLSNDMGDEANGQYSLGLSEKSVPLYRPDQFLQLPDYTAALFYKQNPPIMADLVHYQSVKEWQTHALSNPKAVMDGVPIRYSLKP